MPDVLPAPSLINTRLWEVRRAHYFAVFERALLLLRDREHLPEDEPHLTKELHFTVVTARREIDPDGRFERPFFEAQNLADPDSEWINAHEQKRPDIQWVHDDDAAPDDRHREKSFVIECKRLGKASASGWVFNEEYATNGVGRFQSDEFRYGNHMAEGAMIGFVQNMDLESVLTEINGFLSTSGFSELKLDAVGCVEKAVSRLEQSLIRTFPESPFILKHLWLDIRHIKSVRQPNKLKKGRKSRGVAVRKRKAA